MEIVIIFFTLANIFLAILLCVVSMARMDQTYAATVRAENERKSILRGENRNRR